MLMSLPECFPALRDWIIHFGEFASTYLGMVWCKLTPQADFCPDVQHMMPKPYSHSMDKHTYIKTITLFELFINLLIALLSYQGNQRDH